jgi:hypothetical protein
LGLNHHHHTSQILKKLNRIGIEGERLIKKNNLINGLANQLSRTTGLFDKRLN